MQATGWNNGQARSTGAGYGLRISAGDRDQWFDRSWSHVMIALGGNSVATVRLSASFWGSCTELRSAVIGRWLLSRRLAPWQRGKPPVLTLRPISGNRFELLPPVVG
jgi:hypothetical protein